MRIAVLGAGMAGLVAGATLGLSGATVDVYERWPGLGGQVATVDLGDGSVIERFSTTSLRATSRSRIFTRSWPSGRDRVARIISMAVFADGRTHPFTTPMDLLRFKPLSLASRIRMGAMALALNGPTTWRRSNRSPRALGLRGEWARRRGRRSGALAPGEVRRPRRRDLDGLDLVQIRVRRQVEAARSTQGASRVPTWKLAATSRLPCW